MSWRVSAVIAAVLVAGAATAQDMAFADRAYPTVEEAIAHLPPVPDWCEGAEGDSTCVPVTMAYLGHCSLEGDQMTCLPGDDDARATVTIWRPGWATIDHTHCVDQATQSWRVSCEAADAARVITPPQLCVREADGQSRCPPPRYPPWREGERRE